MGDVGCLGWKRRPGQAQAQGVPRFLRDAGVGRALGGALCGLRAAVRGVEGAEGRVEQLQVLGDEQVAL